MTERYQIGQNIYEAPVPEPGLYLVATPIGHLKDITLRGLEVLAGCDVLACEDTRVTRKLLNRYGISKRLFAYHEHNAESAGPKLLEAVAAGKSVALVSDAGTPLVSDPGFRLVSLMRENGLRVIPIPGASAVLAALMASGLPNDCFTFAGFLPVKSGQRQSRLKAFEAVPTTTIWFESPRRLVACLDDMIAVFGPGRQATIAREMTKTHESVLTAPLSELRGIYTESPKGEIVILVSPPVENAEILSDDEIDAMLLDASTSKSASKAAGLVAKASGRKKTDLYARLMALKS